MGELGRNADPAPSSALAIHWLVQEPTLRAWWSLACRRQGRAGPQHDLAVDEAFGTNCDDPQVSCTEGQEDPCSCTLDQDYWTSTTSEKTASTTSVGRSASANSSRSPSR